MTNNQTTDGNMVRHAHQPPGLSTKQKEQMKKYAVFAVMGIIFAGCIFLIFSPTKDDKAKQVAQAGFNTDIPMPKNEIIIGDKRDAYEQEHVKQRQEERMRSLQDFSALLGSSENSLKLDDDLVLLDASATLSTSGTAATSVAAGTITRTGGSYTQQTRTQSSIQSSAQTYLDLNRSLGSFYETPREDPEKERMREELEELKSRIVETENRRNPVDEQLELMEKSFQMAAKYMPGMSGTQQVASISNGAAATLGTIPTNASPQVETATPASTTPTANNAASGKTTVAPVAQVRERTVTALLPEMTNAEFIETYSKPRNMSFVTVTDQTHTVSKNTFSACVHTEQTVMDGQNVRLRLLEPFQVGGALIPRNTIITGMARIQGERLGVSVVSIEHAGTIHQIALRVYDLDGQSGIFIPNMQELKAAKEIVANMGSSAGTSISLADDAGKQFIADMGRSAIQGVSQFTAKKLREVKVHLKADYKLFLITE